MEHSLWAQTGPSQPSLQMQVKVSPPPTQVPPLEHGLDAQVLILASVGKDTEDSLAYTTRKGTGSGLHFEKQQDNGLKYTNTDTHTHTQTQTHTCVAGAAPPSRGAGTAEGVSVVVTGAPVAAGARVALAFT